jgi:capsular polysaccharide transport system permease protein
MRVEMRSGESGGALLNGLVGQHFVLRALVLRELQSRFGRDNIGYLWVIVEPLMFASAITMIHYVSEQGPGSTPGMGAYPFTLLGYCLFIIFRNGFNRADGAINGVVSLLYHAQITPFDILLSRAIVDVIGALSALLILMTLGIMTGIADLPARPLFLYGAAFAIAALTFGLSLIIAAYTYSSHVLGRFVHPFSYFMFPLSGAFVTMDFLPPWAQGIMAWNPMMSIFEMARYGMFAGASDKHIYPAFMIATCAIVNYWGLIAIRRVRSEIHVG